MRIGAALHCEIRPSIFARKNYFYPDQAKDYQISQYDLPLNAGGWLELPDGFRVGVTRAHMEEDTGKLTHVGASGRINAADHALVDYNRSGVPLVEIVSEPDIRSAAQARAYASELRGILVATGASDGRMEEGSMRVDANVSVRPAGTDRVRHPLRDQEPQLAALARPGDRVRGGPPDRRCSRPGAAVEQETRHWDESAGRTESMRSKEEANDYRYFPEPDLVPLAPDAAWRERVRGSPGPDAGRPPARSWPPRSAASRARPRPTRSAPWSTSASTAGDGGARRPGRRRRWRWPAPPTRWRRRARPGCGSTRGSFAALLAMEAGGPAVGDAVQGRARRAARARRGRPGRAGQGDGLRGPGRRTRSAAVLDEVIAAHPDEWARFVERRRQADWASSRARS